jgi:predicted nucleic acid-binding protein
VILADTSVWIDHLRAGDKEMRARLARAEIVMHPLIVAELALGSLKGRSKILSLLDLLPQVRVAQLSEVRVAIEARHLYSLGIGLIDAQLIASVLIDPGVRLWTRDKKLRGIAGRLGIGAGLN